MTTLNTTTFTETTSTETSTVSLKDNTTSIKPIKPKDSEPKKPFRATNFGKRKLERNQKTQRTNYSTNNYVPYSVNEVQKSINYFGATCGMYSYASALRNYLGLLQKYKKGQLPRVPKYPNICEFQPENPKPYKRPAMYQGVGNTATPSSYSQEYVPPSSHEIVVPEEKEVTLLHEIPEEICVMIK